MDGHTVRAGSEDPELVIMQVAISNAFNTVSRDGVLEQDLERTPEFGPYAAYAYRTPSMLYVEGAPDGSTPLQSRDGVWQGDPLGALLFTLAIQPVLESAAALHADCSIVD